jgi:hypothetical protein
MGLVVQLQASWPVTKVAVHYMRATAARQTQQRVSDAYFSKAVSCKGTQSSLQLLVLLENQRRRSSESRHS